MTGSQQRLVMTIQDEHQDLITEYRLTEADLTLVLDTLTEYDDEHDGTLPWEAWIAAWQAALRDIRRTKPRTGERLTELLLQYITEIRAARFHWYSQYLRRQKQRAEAH